MIRRHRARGRIERLSVDLPASNSPPREFRLFVSGENETTKGTFTFDASAANDVMTAYRKHGVDLAIDLEHLSLDPESASYDPDARGWCKLELRDDGSLWAVDVKWTDDGAARLSNKRQRYVSPAFTVDTKTNRVLEMINIALVAMPATHATPALIAASRLGRDDMKKDLEMVLGLLEEEDIEGAKKLVQKLAAEAEAEEKIKAEKEAPPGDEAEAAEADPSEPTSKKLMRLTKTSTATAALKSVVQLRNERDALVNEKRVRLYRSLVLDAGRTPASVWADPQVKDVPKPHIAAMSMADLEEHVEEEIARANGGKKPVRYSAGRGPIGVPEGTGRGVGFVEPGGKQIELSNGGTYNASAREVRRCRDMKIDIQKYAELRAETLANRPAAAR